MRKVYEIFETSDGGFTVDTFLYKESEELPNLLVERVENVFGLCDAYEEAVYKIFVETLSDLERRYDVTLHECWYPGIKRNKPKHEKL